MHADHGSAGPGLQPGLATCRALCAIRWRGCTDEVGVVPEALGARGLRAERALLPPQDLVNIEMFLTAKEVEESLERRETATCLAWCHDNKSRLRKMKVRRPGAGLCRPLLRRRLRGASAGPLGLGCPGGAPPSALGLGPMF